GRADVYRPSVSRDAYLDARAGAAVTALLAEYGDVFRLVEE
ncbi:MAG: hypothetical protein QOI18_1986, partial [Solirubrobacteraceae bacterium]|nr:hypothetical protein [Solirubrobacteraceae bacterium]